MQPAACSCACCKACSGYLHQTKWMICWQGHMVRPLAMQSTRVVHVLFTHNPKELRSHSYSCCMQWPASCMTARGCHVLAKGMISDGLNSHFAHNKSTQSGSLACIQSSAHVRKAGVQPRSLFASEPLFRDQ